MVWSWSKAHWLRLRFLGPSERRCDMCTLSARKGQPCCSDECQTRAAEQQDTLVW